MAVVLAYLIMSVAVGVAHHEAEESEESSILVGIAFLAVAVWVAAWLLVEAWAEVRRLVRDWA